MHEIEGGGRERHAGRASSDGEPVRDVGSSLVPRQRFEFETNGDSLVQLSKIRRAEGFLQIHLADQHYLKQLLLVGFEIRQNPYLFQDLTRQILRLVQDQ